MTEQGRELLGAGCGNREGRRLSGEDGLGGRQAACSSGLRPLLSKGAFNRLLSLGDQAHLEVIR